MKSSIQVGSPHTSGKRLLLWARYGQPIHNLCQNEAAAPLQIVKKMNNLVAYLIFQPFYLQN